MHVSLFILILCVYRCGFAWSLDIFEAVSSDSAQAIQDVVAKGPSSLLNKKGPGGQTPLMNAVLSGKKNAVEALLQAGADVNIPEQLQW